MKYASSRSSIIATFLSLLFILIFLLAFSPTQWGGVVTYVIVDGNSMETKFHRGDLVLVRTEPVYMVGDAVVYRNEEMRSFVFHRIVGMELDHFVMKGDHNSWLDSYKPVQDEVIGKLWIHIPKFGKAIEWVRTPVNISLTVGLLGGVFMFDLFGKPSQRRKWKKLTLPNLGRILEGALYGFGSLAVVFLVLGIYSFTRPLNHPAEKIPYQQEGYFIYSATGTPGVYDTDIVRAGEPVFPKLTCFLNINFTYNLSGDRLQGISGNYKMYARVLDEQSGWQRTIPLNAQTTFNGNSYFSTATLDLCQVESLVNLVEQQAGLKQIVYSLEIVTDVVFAAKVDGNPVSDSFSPSLIFKYDKIHFYLAATEGQTNPFHSTKSGLASSSSLQSNTISILGLKFPVRTARFLSVLGFGSSLLGFILVGVNVYRTTTQSQETLIRLRYGSVLVDVHKQSIAPSSSIIELATIGDLARLAERHGTMILHVARNSLHYYLVQINGTTYCYVGNTDKNSITETKLPSDEIVQRAKPVKKEPTFVPLPVRAESLDKRADQPEDKTVHALTIQKEKTATAPIRVAESKIPIAEPALEEATEYMIDIDRIKSANRIHEGSIEYIIDTGVVEVVMHQQETKY